MTKKLSVIILSILMLFSMSLALTACGKEDEPQQPHEHTFATDWTTDETHHWHACKGDGCNDVKDKAEHDYATVVTNATCTEQGYTTYTCRDCGYSYIDNYTKANGHRYAEGWTYDESGHWHASTCGHESEINDFEAHNCQPTNVVPPTCTSEGYTVYECACGYSYHGAQITKIAHSVTTWEEKKATLYDPSCCKYAVVYSGVCSGCSQVQTKTEYIERHDLYTDIVSEATCVAQGEKHILCHDCSHCEVVHFDAPAGVDCHHWVAAPQQLGGGVIVYVCDNSGCTATKTIVEASGDNVGVTGDQLDNISEIKLDTATIALSSDVKQNLKDKNTVIDVSATTLQGTALDEAKQKLSPEDLEKLGTNQVYDFSFVSNGESIGALGGTVTISLPYDVTGKDPDNIIVFYMNDGNITPIKATYSNGFVFFETDHFSIYTVAEIKPEEYCEYYNEHGKLHVVDPTCTTGGYTVCLRCGEIIATTDALGHDFESEIISACTCTQNGVIKHTCTHCGETYQETIPAIGHNFVVVEQVNATCKTAGYIKYRCANCGNEYTVFIPQLDHEFISEAVDPTCTEKGYTKNTCLLCGEVIITDYVESAGHDFAKEWTADGDGHYHVCLVCGEKGEKQAHVGGAEATETTAKTCVECGYVLEAPLGHIHANHVEQVDATASDCTTAGNIEYFVCECGQWFLDQECTQLIADKNSVIIRASGHTTVVHKKLDATCTEDGYTEGLWCEVCKTYISGHTVIPAMGHKHTKVVTAPTCTEDGFTTYTCACGDTYVGDTVPAHGHGYIKVVTAPTCTEDGFTTYTCKYCNDTYTDDFTDELGHSWLKEFESDETHHWHACARCGELSEKCAHNPDYQEATEEHGITCVDCGYVIAKRLNHTHVVSATVAKEATCTTIGNIAYYVCECGEWFYDADATQPITDHALIIIKALDHNYHLQSDGHEHYQECSRCHDKLSAEACYGGKATCEHLAICDKCGNEYGELAPHTYVDVETAPTCIEQGYTTHTCLVCGDTNTDSYVSALDHDIIHHDAKAVTCTEIGWNAYDTCSRCDYTTYEEIPALDHDVSREWTGDEKGHYHACSRCDARIDEQVHVPDYEKATTEHGITCTVCGYEIVKKLEEPTEPDEQEFIKAFDSSNFENVTWDNPMGKQMFDYPNGLVFIDANTGNSSFQIMLYNGNWYKKENGEWAKAQESDYFGFTYEYMVGYFETCKTFDHYYKDGAWIVNMYGGTEVAFYIENGKLAYLTTSSEKDTHFYDYGTTVIKVPQDLIDFIEKQGDEPEKVVQYTANFYWNELDFAVKFYTDYKFDLEVQRDGKVITKESANWEYSDGKVLAYFNGDPLFFEIKGDELIFIDPSEQGGDEEVDFSDCKYGGILKYMDMPIVIKCYEGGEGFATIMGNPLPNTNWTIDENGIVSVDILNMVFEFTVSEKDGKTLIEYVKEDDREPVYIAYYRGMPIKLYEDKTCFLSVGAGTQEGAWYQIAEKKFIIEFDGAEIPFELNEDDKTLSVYEGVDWYQFRLVVKDSYGNVILTEPFELDEYNSIELEVNVETLVLKVVVEYTFDGEIYKVRMGLDGIYVPGLYVLSCTTDGRVGFMSFDLKNSKEYVRLEPIYKFTCNVEGQGEILEGQFEFFDNGAFLLIAEKNHSTIIDTCGRYEMEGDVFTCYFLEGSGGYSFFEKDSITVIMSDEPERF